MSVMDGTTLAQKIPTDIPLGACPSWPVLFSLPERGEQVLLALRHYRIGTSPGATAGTRAIIAAAILHMPEDPQVIVALSNFSPAAGPAPPPGKPGDMFRRRTNVRLPAPLTLRLNRLIQLTAEETGQRCSRTAVVVSLMRLARADSKQLWRDRFTTVMTRPAGEAVPRVDAARPETVLRLVRPSPGPRPQSQASVPDG